MPLCRQRSAGSTPLRLAQTAPSQRSEDAGPDRTTELKSPSRSRPRGNQQQNQVPSSASSAAAVEQLRKQLQEKIVESKAALNRTETRFAEEDAIVAQLRQQMEQVKVTLWRPSSRSRSRSHRCTAAPPMHLSRSRSRGHRQTEEPPVGEWKEHKAPSGRTYYCNTVTRCASWEKPGAKQVPPARPLDKEGPASKAVASASAPQETSSLHKPDMPAEHREPGRSQRASPKKV